MAQQISLQNVTCGIAAFTLATFCWISTPQAQQPIIGATPIDATAPAATASATVAAPAIPLGTPAPAPAPAPAAPPVSAPAAAPMTTAPASPVVPPQQPTPPPAPVPALAPTPAAAPAPAAAAQMPMPEAPATNVNDTPVPANGASEKKADNEGLDMGGRAGFAVGLAGGSDMTPLSVGTSLGLRLWLSDKVALQPRLQMDLNYDDQSEVFGYGVTPGIGMLFAVYRGKTTRVNFGFGFEFGFYGKQNNGDSESSYYNYSDTSNDVNGSTALHRYNAYANEDAHELGMTEVGVGRKAFYLGLPIELQIEHFFSDRLSGFIGAKFPLISFVQEKSDNGEGDPINTFAFSLDSTSLIMGLIFYTN